MNKIILLFKRIFGKNKARRQLTDAKKDYSTLNTKPTQQNNMGKSQDFIQEQTSKQNQSSEEKNANHANQRNEFFDSLKVNEVEENEEISEAEKDVLVCVGDGLGIKSKLSA